MFKKLNPKKLLLVFAILLAIVIISKVYDNNKGEKTFKSELAVIDTANVSAITFYPKAEKKGIKLLKKGKEWSVAATGKEYHADMNLISGILNSIAMIKAERVAATDKSQWKDFEVTDTAGTRVQVEVKGKTAAEFIIGKFSYKQSNGGFSMSYYVRLAGETEVYSVQGQLNMMLNRDLNAFRDKTIIKAKREDFTKLTFSYPGDSSFVLENRNNQWLLNNEPADSAKVLSYLGTISNYSGYSFADEKTNAGNEAVYKLNVEGRNFSPIEVSAFPSDSISKFVLISSKNTEAKFISGSTKLAENLFKGKGSFLK